MRPKLVVLVGLPRSGKSSYSRKWASECSNRVVVSNDMVQKALTGKTYCGPATGMSHEIYYTMIKTLIMEGYEVLADDTHTSYSSLLKLISIDPNCTHVLIDTPEEVCIQRAKDNNQEYLIKPIQRLAKQFRQNFKDGFDETIAKLKEEYRKSAGKYHGEVP